jgi:hypothetical protein
VKWTVDFYNERRATVARYDIDAPTAAAAVVSGRQALRAIDAQSLTMRRQVVTLIVAAVVFGSSSIGRAQVPKAEDIAACNMEAQHTVRKGAASPDSAQPNTKDHRRAEARRMEPTSQGAAGGTQSDDPQLAGMDTEGARDPAYQAAYRTCMRRAGF